ncbi:unnamed protein product, partial [marine sediment metagenome]
LDRLASTFRKAADYAEASLGMEIHLVVVSSTGLPAVFHFDDFDELTRKINEYRLDARKRPGISHNLFIFHGTQWFITKGPTWGVSNGHMVRPLIESVADDGIVDAMGSMDDPLAGPISEDRISSPEEMAVPYEPVTPAPAAANEQEIPLTDETDAVVEAGDPDPEGSTQF